MYKCSYTHEGVIMTIISFSDARSSLTDVVNEVAYAGKRMILTRKGKQLAAIIPIKDLQVLEEAIRKVSEGKTTTRRKRKRAFKAEDKGNA